ncbi:ABC transporter permease [Limnochorda pilosa]|uniref:Transport permease protein n=1 Tax=Limnochorda pilosa TaxID=1555112 RepID=A0A0K2SGW5_LIMPI|nr:ABC transporter permease [Limnochorda pilosa]BAS26356.1 ABC transporter [Limnochorda pilosa]
MSAFRALLAMHLRLYLREPMGAFFTLVFPPAILVLFGVIYGNDPSPLFGGRGTIDVMVPAYLAMVVGTVGFFSVPVGTGSMREKGILRRFWATPLRPGTYLAADVTSDFLMTLAGVVLLIIVGRLVFDMRFDGVWWSAAAGFLLSAGAFLALGYLLASLASSSRTAMIAGMTLFYPMLFLSGATIPLEVMPARVQAWAAYLPLHYVVRLMRALWAGGRWSDQVLSVAVLAGILVVSTAVSARFFRWE